MAQSAAFTSITSDLQRVESALLEVVPSEYPEIADIIVGLIRAGGKRVRPALLLLSARCNDYDLERLIPGAIATELLHTATLVHDDTIDQAATRRGQATINSFLPDSGAILIGDYIFAQSAICAAAPGSPAVVTVFARTLREIVDGELRQALANHRVEVSRVEYNRRIYAKTAALFAAACEIGALLSDAPDDHRTALRTYGKKIGQAYQIVDDILDFTATSQQAGKPVGGDLRHGTATLPTIIALEQKSWGDAEAQWILDVLSGVPGANADRAVAIIRESGAIGLAHGEARKLADEACAALLTLPSTDARNSLYDMAEMLVERDR
ncbi:MAG: polyprenyl synthetase family protein [Chloroflexia bacterium]|nr:polyprenyl synthetase family protein [Chloroflexia bacterium]